MEVDVDRTPLNSTARPPAGQQSGQRQGAGRPVAADRSQGASSRRERGRSSSEWRRRYARRLWISDLLVLLWVVFGTQIVWFGFNPEARFDFNGVTYWTLSAVLIGLWMTALALSDTRSYRVIGVGTVEYVRVADASLRLFGIIAIVAFLLDMDIARGFLLISLPLGISVLVLERWLWRVWLGAKRKMGQYSARVLLVGSEASVTQIASDLLAAPSAGYNIVGACVPHRAGRSFVSGTHIPIIGNVDEVPSAMAVTGADTVAVTSSDALSPSAVREISWLLEPGRQHLVLAPNLVDVAGPRIHSRPVAGLPLIHVETPRFSAGQKLVKRAFDIAVSFILLILLAPVLIVVALTVRTTSPGPVFFSHERIGQDGRPFRMLKFRSMRANADAELASLLKEQGTEAQPLFKINNDPRITPVGRILRKYSLDELPQLLNVFSGSMSLVGPRPQVAAEVALYSNAARRRLVTRPGVTGLWQVSGRSSLTWEQAVRLDLYYVENWSLLSDIVILLRTVKAVVAPSGTAH